MDASSIIVDPAATYCNETLKLRHKMQKLHWMGLDREADQLALDIEALERYGPTVIAPLVPDTD